MISRIRLWYHNWDIGYALKIWVIWMVCIMAVSATMIARVPAGNAHSLSAWGEELSVWSNWDGNNYVMIARDGYDADTPLPLHAFFPLLPVLMNGLHQITGISHQFAGVVISRLATLGAIIYLINLLKLDFSRKIAFRAAWFMLLFPTSFFFFSIFTESLFLFVTLASWYYARVGKWWASGIFAFFAPLTRLLGVFILPVQAWYFYQRNRKNISYKTFINALPLALGVLGFGTWIVFNWIDTGNPLHFIQVQEYWSAHGRGGYHNPLWILGTNLWRTLRDIPTRSIFVLGYFDVWFSLATAGTLTWAAMRRLIPWEYILWGFTMITIPIISGSLVSMPRYVLTVFPIYLVLSQLASKDWFEKVYTLGSTLLLANLLVMWLFAHWVA